MAALQRGQCQHFACCAQGTDIHLNPRLRRFTQEFRGYCRSEPSSTTHRRTFCPSVPICSFANTETTTAKPTASILSPNHTFWGDLGRSLLPKAIAWSLRRASDPCSQAKKCRAEQGEQFTLLHKGARKIYLRSKPALTHL